MAQERHQKKRISRWWVAFRVKECAKDANICEISQIPTHTSNASIARFFNSDNSGKK